MFIIDFNSPEQIRAAISEMDQPAWAVPVFDFIKTWMDDSVQYFAVHTSGSTGTPKEIQHSRAAMIASAERTCDFFHLQAGDTVLLALPSSHIGGRMMIARSMIRRLKLICIEPKSDPFATLLYVGEIDLAAFTPMQMSVILEQHPDRRHLSQIRNIILGGGEVSNRLRQNLATFTSSVYETYGMTETVSHIALKKINGVDASEAFTVLDDIEISVDDRGCMVIEMPDMSEEIVTNDLIQLLNDRQFKWLGRYDNIINTGGIKVSAEEIERKLQPFMDNPFFITGTPHDILGQQVTLIIDVPDIPVDKAYKDIFATALGKYEYPKLIKAIHPFSYTENGKLNKQKTLERLQ